MPGSKDDTSVDDVCVPGRILLVSITWNEGREKMHTKAYSFYTLASCACRALRDPC